MDAEKITELLLSRGGVSGKEKELFSVLENILSESGDITTDNLGNFFCTINKGAEGKKILLDAHIDKIGLIVKFIDENGFVKCDSCGGMDWRVLAGEEVVIMGKEPVKGIVCSVPPHLSSGDESKALDSDSLFIDTGFDGEALKKKIALGDRVCVEKTFAKLLSGCITAPALDNRAGAAAIIAALKLLTERGYKGEVTCALTVQEEVGTRGAGPAVFKVKPDEAIVVDVSFGLSPGLKDEECGKLKKGPMIGISPTLDEKITATLMKVCEEENIPFQREVMGGRTGTNADVVSVNSGGIKTGLVSVPLRYMHTAAEVVDTLDIENTAKLIACYIEKGGCYDD